MDAYVGKRLKARREHLGLRQQDMAAVMGVSCQQVQKYEAGLNRLSASRMFLAAQKLGVDMAYFYEGYGRSERTPVADKARLNDLYERVDDPRIQRGVLALLGAVV